MARLVFDPDGDILLTLSFPAKVTAATSEEQAKDDTSGGSEGSHVEMLVSSRHLMLASPVFKAMLQPHFAEGLALKSTGHATIPLFDDDPRALDIIMRIIHCQVKRVPDELDLRELTHLTVLVDKYQLHVMIGFFAHKWIHNLRGTLPADVCFNTTELSGWLCISWVFKQRRLFKHTTMLAIQYFTDDPYEGIAAGYPEDLPIPQMVMEKIEDERDRGIKCALLMIENAIKIFQDNTRIKCIGSAVPLAANDAHKFSGNLILARFCDCATLGALIKAAIAKQLYPSPTPPYRGLAYTMVINQVRAVGMLIPSYCQEMDKAKNADTRGRYTKLKKCHGLDESIPSTITALTSSLQGLDLRDFWSDPKSSKVSPKVGS